MLENNPMCILSTQQNKILSRATPEFLDIMSLGTVMMLEKRARGIF